jgi:hypothetical protein
MFEIGAFSTFHSLKMSLVLFLTTTAVSTFGLGKAAASLLRGNTCFRRLRTRIFTRVGIVIGAIWLDLWLAALLFLFFLTVWLIVEFEHLLTDSTFS